MAFLVTSHMFSAVVGAFVVPIAGIPTLASRCIWVVWYLIVLGLRVVKLVFDANHPSTSSAKRIAGSTGNARAIRVRVATEYLWTALVIPFALAITIPESAVGRQRFLKHDSPFNEERITTRVFSDPTVVQVQTCFAVDPIVALFLQPLAALV